MIINNKLASTSIADLESVGVVYAIFWHQSLGSATLQYTLHNHVAIETAAYKRQTPALAPVFSHSCTAGMLCIAYYNKI